MLKFLSLFFILLGSVTAQFVQAEPVSDACDGIVYFYKVGCPHCARAEGFLNVLQAKHPDLQVSRYDVTDSDKGLPLFLEFNEQFNIEQPGVPFMVLCGGYIIGYDSDATTGQQIERALGLIDGVPQPPAEEETYTLPLLGEIDVEQYGLPLLTIAIGLIDGFNPCAMWVLLFLLSLLINLKQRTRIIIVAGTFVLISGLVYFAFMAAWLNLFLIIGFSRILQLIVGVSALGIGSIHIKDYFAYKKGISLSIPESSKPGLYARMRGVIYAENLWASLIAVTILAILVNMVELLCTAGLPAVYTHILTSQQLPVAQYYAYLVLYNLAYIFDDALMVSIVVFTLSRTKIQETTGRILKLISGLVIVVLGVALLFFPELLV